MITINQTRLSSFYRRGSVGVDLPSGGLLPIPWHYGGGTTPDCRFLHVQGSSELNPWDEEEWVVNDLGEVCRRPQGEVRAIHIRR